MRLALTESGNCCRRFSSTGDGHIPSAGMYINIDFIGLRNEVDIAKVVEPNRLPVVIP